MSVIKIETTDLTKSTLNLVDSKEDRIALLAFRVFMARLAQLRKFTVLYHCSSSILQNLWINQHLS